MELFEERPKFSLSIDEDGKVLSLKRNQKHTFRARSLAGARANSTWPTEDTSFVETDQI